MQNFLLSKSGRSPLAGDRIIENVLAGEVVLIEGALGAFGVLEKNSLLTLNTIKNQCGAALSAEVERGGFENIHLVLSSAQIEKLYTGVRHGLTLNMKVAGSNR